jgi:pimeloyl-ACP methyl ester carboxylesterase
MPQAMTGAMPGNVTAALAYEQLGLSVDGVGLRVATVGRDGELAPMVFLHGFGSTKEDYVDIAFQPAFAGRPFLAYDAPGCGETSCADLSKISIPFLVETAQTVLERTGSGVSIWPGIPWVG